MEISQQLLCFLFLASFVFGILWGILYDVLYLFRFFFAGHCDKKVKSASSVDLRAAVLFRVLLFCEDFLFVFLGGIGLLLLSYLINDGVFRLWGPCGMFAGFYVYRVTVSSWVLHVCKGLIRLLRHLLKWIWQIFWLPVSTTVRWVFRLFFAPMIKFISRKRYEKSLGRSTRRMESFLNDADQIFSDPDEILWKD